MLGAVSAKGPSLDDTVSTRFARSPYFLTVDTDTLEFEHIANTPSVGVTVGLGLRAAWILVNRGVSALITGRVGVNARRILTDHEIKIIAEASDVSVRQALSRSGSMRRQFPTR
jgi:predicted Fe-Mo cluster-binding NifX family protein